MPRNGAGIYSLPSGNPVTSGTAISSTVQNNTTSDIATALTGSLASDGQTVPTANLPMGGFKHTGAADGSNPTDYATVGQLQSSFGTNLGSVSGTNTITASATPTLTAYASGQEFVFTSAGANTGAVTLNINSLGAKAVTVRGATALKAGDIVSGMLVNVRYDGTQFQLLNPATLLLSGGTVAGAVSLGSTLAVTGAATLSSTLGVTGAATLSSTLGVAGVATFTTPPVAPTQAGTDNSTKIATTAHVLARLQVAPAFRAAQSISQSLTTATATKIDFGTEEFDTNNNFASSRFTPTVAGYYQICWGVGVTGTNITDGYASIYQNGSEVERGSQIAANSGSAVSASGSRGACVLTFNGSTDYVEVYAKFTGSSLSAGFNRFSGCLIRPL